MERISVLHVLPSNQFSGAENVVCQIINIFRDDQRYRMIYCSPDGAIRDALSERMIAYAPMREFSATELKRIIHETDPSIIHAHDMKAAVMAAAVCGKTPLIAHVHNNNFDVRGISAKSILFYLAAIKAKHIFWVSKSSLEGYCFHKQFLDKSTILYNMIDAKALREKMRTDGHKYAYDIVFIGRLTRQKNPYRLLEVLKRVLETAPAAKIAIIGQGDLAEETKAQAVRLKIEKNVDFLGFQSNPYKILHDAKLMIMTSLWEGTPMCALEAMALGVPIVSTPTDGMCELVNDGQTGYLRDDDQQLADCCLNIINDHALREAMLTATLKRADAMMDMTQYKAAILKVYQNAVK